MSAELSPYHVSLVICFIPSTVPHSAIDLVNPLPALCTRPAPASLARPSASPACGTRPRMMTQIRRGCRPNPYLILTSSSTVTQLSLASQNPISRRAFLPHPGPQIFCKRHRSDGQFSMLLSKSALRRLGTCRSRLFDSFVATARSGSGGVGGKSRARNDANLCHWLSWVGLGMFRYRRGGKSRSKSVPCACALVGIRGPVKGIPPPCEMNWTLYDEARPTFIRPLRSGWETANTAAARGGCFAGRRQTKRNISRAAGAASAARSETH